MIPLPSVAQVATVRQLAGRALALDAIDRVRALRARRLRGRPEPLPFAPPHARAMAWLSEVLGVDFATHPCRQLGVSAGRVLLVEDEAGARFEWCEAARAADELAGTRVVLVPTLGDVVAIDPERPELAWPLSGHAEPLGWGPQVEDALLGDEAAIAVARDSLSWLRHVERDAPARADGSCEPGIAARFACHASNDGAPMIAIAQWSGSAVDTLMRHPDLALIAEDDEHAAALERAVDAWRRAQVPRHRPRFLVAEAAP